MVAGHTSGSAGCRYGDEFVDYPTLVRLCPEQSPLPLNHADATGSLKGRPIDLLRTS